MVSSTTKKQRVYNYLKRARKYVPGDELTQPDVGGPEGLRRVRELRQEGVDISVRRNPDTRQWEYKIDR
jgi:hypothetical protein